MPWIRGPAVSGDLRKRQKSCDTVATGASPISGSPTKSLSGFCRGNLEPAEEDGPLHVLNGLGHIDPPGAGFRAVEHSTAPPDA